MAKNLVTLEELQNSEDDWLNREGLGDEDDHNAWLEEGIRIYEQFASMELRNTDHRVILSRLYLEWGWDEKMRKGNELHAQKILRNAVILSPDNPNAYYHLSFISANQHKWESVLFYAREALENGLAQDKKVKLLCNMALGYSRLGLRNKANGLFSQADEFDNAGKYQWFIELYRDQLKIKNSKRILLKPPNEERAAVTREDYERIRDKAMSGSCIALDLSQHEKYFYTVHDAVKLERREAEILGYLMDQLDQPCSRKDIKEAVWPDREVGDATVKKYISKLRSKLEKALNRKDIPEAVLVTTGRIYTWKLDVEQFVLR